MTSSAPTLRPLNATAHWAIAVRSSGSPRTGKYLFTWRHGNVETIEVPFYQFKTTLCCWSSGLGKWLFSGLEKCLERCLIKILEAFEAALMIQQTSFLENNLHFMNMPSSACSRNFRTIPDRQKMHEGIQNCGRWCVQEGGSNNSWVSPPQTRTFMGPNKRKKQQRFILRSGTIRYRKWTLTKSKCINFLGWWILSDVRGAKKP